MGLNPRKWDKPQEKTVTMTVKRWKMFLFISSMIGFGLGIILMSWF